jgi:hypothetical protein
LPTPRPIPQICARTGRAAHRLPFGELRPFSNKITYKLIEGQQFMRQTAPDVVLHRQEAKKCFSAVYFSFTALCDNCYRGTPIWTLYSARQEAAAI